MCSYSLFSVRKAGLPVVPLLQTLPTTPSRGPGPLKCAHTRVDCLPLAGLGQVDSELRVFAFDLLTAQSISNPDLHASLLQILFQILSNQRLPFIEFSLTFPTINLLQSLTELRKSFAYVYQFILKGNIKNTGEQPDQDALGEVWKGPK